MTSKIVVNNIEADVGVSTVAVGSKVSATEFIGPVTGNVTGNVSGGTLTGITSVSTTNLTVNGNAYPSAGPLSNRNLIINGSMQVAQRGTQSTSVTDTNFRTVDRFKDEINGLGTWTIDQSTDAPDDFSFSYKATCTTADASPAANDYSFVGYKVEARDLQKLNYGSSAARAMTLSFWVKSNKTGNATVTVLQRDNSIKLLSPQYSISSADTWEYKTISIPGDTSGVINNDNGSGLEFEFYYNAGSTYTGGSHQTTWSTYANANRCPSALGVGGATSDYFAITGVQLEVGQVATPFEHRSYGEELALCQRYYYKIGGLGSVSSRYGAAHYETSNAVRGQLFHPVPMRNPPTWNISGNIRFYTDAGRTYSGATLGGSQSLADGTSFMSYWSGTTSTNGTTGYAGFVDNAGVSAPYTGYIEANAEL